MKTKLIFLLTIILSPSLYAAEKPHPICGNFSAEDLIQAMFDRNEINVEKAKMIMCSCPSRFHSPSPERWLNEQDRDLRDKQHKILYHAIEKNEQTLIPTILETMGSFSRTKGPYAHFGKTSFHYLFEHLAKAEQKNPLKDPIGMTQLFMEYYYDEDGCRTGFSEYCHYNSSNRVCKTYFDYHTKLEQEYKQKEQAKKLLAQTKRENDLTAVLKNITVQQNAGIDNNKS